MGDMLVYQRQPQPIHVKKAQTVMEAADSHLLKSPPYVQSDTPLSCGQSPGRRKIEID
jgi:hypothetical protein